MAGSEFEVRSTLVYSQMGTCEASRPWVMLTRYSTPTNMNEQNSILDWRTKYGYSLGHVLNDLAGNIPFKQSIG